LIAWCGGGVPERTKGYFTTHTAAVSKILHGYHVQITARSDSDLEPESIVKKIADASGAKYSGGSSAGASPAPPPLASKPVFTPTPSYSSSSNPIVSARNQRGGNVDADGWGEDAPPVTRSEIQRVESAYKPTKVNISELTGQKQAPSRFVPPARDEDRAGVIGGGYQPIGKVDIAAIRAAAKTQNDDRPTTVKGAYEPVGKVDIAAIRAKAQKPAEPTPPSRDDGGDEPVKSLADRSAAFNQPSSDRLTSLPKPKVANKFGGGSYTGTKPPAPGGGLGLHSPSVAPGTVPQVGAAGRSFAAASGKTPAQLWAEKKAREGGGAPSPTALDHQKSGTPASPIGIQKSGEWKSGYQGKSWASVQTGDYGRGVPGQISQENTGEDNSRSVERSGEDASPSGGVSALKDRFKNAAPIGIGAPPIPQPAHDEPEPEPEQEREPSPPPPASSSRPTGGFALPGLPSRPPPADEEEDEPSPPPPPSQRPEPQQTQSYQQSYDDEPEHSPVRVAVPVGRGPDEARPPSPDPIPVETVSRQVPREEEIADEPRDAGRGASTTLAEQEFGQQQVHASQTQAGGKRALVQYDYEKAEDNEIELREGEYVTNIDMVDDDWWMGTNAQGHSGLFPSNYVEIVAENGPSQARPASPPAPAPQAAPAPAPAPAAAPAQPAGNGKTATALFDYEAAEDNGKNMLQDPLMERG
jgi:drebrin-like protein